MKVFEVKVAHNTENGCIKESYFVDALSYTEAETRIIQELAATAGTVEILTVTKTQVTEVIDNTDTDSALADKWYKAKVDWPTLDNDQEKHVYAHYLVKAESVSDALGRLEHEFKEYGSDHDVKAVTETQALDFYKWHAKDDGDEKTEEGK